MMTNERNGVIIATKTIFVKDWREMIAVRGGSLIPGADRGSSWISGNMFSLGVCFIIKFLFSRYKIKEWRLKRGQQDGKNNPIALESFHFFREQELLATQQGKAFMLMGDA